MTLRGARVLVTGATGTVGSEVVETLRRVGAEVVGSSAHGDRERDVVRWNIVKDPVPCELRGAWDVIVHAAADTRWNLAPDVAHAANADAVGSLGPLLGASTRLVTLSTTYAAGIRGNGSSPSLDDYRNTYEWSKAAGERIALELGALVLRFPIVLGRRTDGHVERLGGFFKLLRSMTSGLLPAIVAEASAPLEIIGVDDVANQVLVRSADTSVGVVNMGRGRRTLSVATVLDVFFDTLDHWRRERAVDPVPRPPILDPERWDRFFYPFARESLSSLQLRSIEVFSEFRSYMTLDAPSPCDVLIADPTVVIEQTTSAWAMRMPVAASATPERWS